MSVARSPITHERDPLLHCSPDDRPAARRQGGGGDCLCGAQTIRGVLHYARLFLDDHSQIGSVQNSRIFFAWYYPANFFGTARQFPATEEFLLLRSQNGQCSRNHHETTAPCERLGGRSVANEFQIVIYSICAPFSVARFIISGGYYRDSVESVIESIVR